MPKSTGRQSGRREGKILTHVGARFYVSCIMYVTLGVEIFSVPEVGSVDRG